MAKILTVMNYTLKDFNGPELELEQLVKFSSVPQNEIIKKNFGEERPDILQRYWKYFESVYSGSIELIDGAMDLLKKLKREGIYVAIVSNQKGDQLRTHVKKSGLLPYVDHIVGAGDIENRKPDIQAMEAALSFSNIHLNDEHSSSVWIVGDSEVDIQAAIQSKTYAILIEEYSTLKDLRESVNGYPLLKIKSIKNLIHVIDKLLN
jgi:phosphoglycolate phosphatase